MTTNHRLFVDAPLASDRSIYLPPDASHYLARVLRLRAGANVTLFNGNGNNYTAELLNADKKSAELRVLDEHPGPQSQPRLNLAIALLKGDKLDLALQNGPFSRDVTGMVRLGAYPMVWIASPDLGVG